MYADGAWVNAKELQVGYEIVSADGDVGIVEAIERIDAPQMMYNLSVAVVATYVVGDGRWVVHNDEALIRIQRQIGNEIFRDVLGGRNILFGQKRVSPWFSTGGLVPDQLQGQEIFNIAEQLRLGQLDTDLLPIRYFETPAGQLVTIHNRGLATLYMAGFRPTQVIQIPYNQVKRDILNRLREHVVIPNPNNFQVPDNLIQPPSRTIAITKTWDPKGIDEFIDVVHCPF